jgi:hypothetical protein
LRFLFSVMHFLGNLVKKALKNILEKSVRYKSMRLYFFFPTVKNRSSLSRFYEEPFLVRLFFFMNLEVKIGGDCNAYTYVKRVYVFFFRSYSVKIF